MSETESFVCVGRTHVGRVRTHNEDAFFTTPGCAVCAVADGMGGHERGEVASAIAVETFQKTFTGSVGGGDIVEHLADAVRAANRAIFARSVEDGRSGSMGTTIVAAAIRNAAVVVAHVGDSRAYVVHKGRLTQITRDHSFVWELYEQGVITFEEMRSHPRRNIVTRALGSNPEVDVEMREVDYHDGDIVLLCSDGLNGMFTDPEIAGIIAEHTGDLDEAAGRLVDAANEAGGHDNITVVLLRQTGFQ